MNFFFSERCRETIERRKGKRRRLAGCSWVLFLERGKLEADSERGELRAFLLRVMMNRTPGKVSNGTGNFLPFVSDVAWRRARNTVSHPPASSHPPSHCYTFKVGTGRLRKRIENSTTRDTVTPTIWREILEDPLIPCSWKQPRRRRRRNLSFDRGLRNHYGPLNTFNVGTNSPIMAFMNLSLTIGLALRRFDARDQTL